MGRRGSRRVSRTGTPPPRSVRKGAGGCVRAHGCGLTGKMTGGRPKIRLGPSAITLNSISVMALPGGKPEISPRPHRRTQRHLRTRTLWPTPDPGITFGWPVRGAVAVNARANALPERRPARSLTREPAPAERHRARARLLPGAVVCPRAAVSSSLVPPQHAYSCSLSERPPETYVVQLPCGMSAAWFSQGTAGDTPSLLRARPRAHQRRLGRLC